MPLSQDQFKQRWEEAGEQTTDAILDVAWRRYQYVSTPQYQVKAENDEPSLGQLKAAFIPLLEHASMKSKIISYRFLTLPANNIPWLATGVDATEDHAITVLPTGRTWRSRLLDLYLPAQFNLWYRIGVNGAIFNSTRDTKTFKSIEGQAGELYLANQFPGSFHDRHGGRVGGNLAMYEKAEGAFQVLIVKWANGLSIREDVKCALEELLEISHQLAAQDSTKHNADPYSLLTIGIERISSDYFSSSYPPGWTLLWFLGQSEIYTQRETTADIEDSPQASATGAAGHDNAATDSAATLLLPSPSPLIDRTLSRATTPMIHCLPDRNVGILQKDLVPPVPLTSATTTAWWWNVLSLPSRLREDTSISHDYLSLAFEFENGRDLTYTWSWELEELFGYWCPLDAWRDREYHVVLRSGTELLGTWLHERRNLYADYVRYINGGDESRSVPAQVTRVWLIAGNRWQRHRGEMLIRNIHLMEDGSDKGPLVVL